MAEKTPDAPAEPLVEPVAVAPETAEVAAEPVAPATTAPATIETVAPSDVPVTVEPITASSEPETIALAETTPDEHRIHEVIVVDAPVPPRKKGNRGIGFALSVGATIVFAALLVAAAFVLSLLTDGDLGFLTEPTFYLPALAFFVGLVIVTLLLNRAGWWSHIIGSVIVGLVTWFGSASLVLLSAGMASMNQAEANDTFYAALFSPILIIAALLAREVSIWTGAILARRGRSLKVRNAEAQEAYEREQADLIPTA